jgi:hypothetical protein
MCRHIVVRGVRLYIPVGTTNGPRRKEREARGGGVMARDATQDVKCM